MDLSFGMSDEGDEVDLKREKRCEREIMRKSGLKRDDDEEEWME